MIAGCATAPGRVVPIPPIIIYFHCRCLSSSGALALPQYPRVIYSENANQRTFSYRVTRHPQSTSPMEAWHLIAESLLSRTLDREGFVSKYLLLPET